MMYLVWIGGAVVSWLTNLLWGVAWVIVLSLMGLAYSLARRP